MGATGSDAAEAFDHRRGAARLRGLPTRLLSLAATHSDRRVQEALAGVGARKWHYAVLATLEEFGPASQAELSTRTGVYRSDLVGVVAELSAAALMDRSPDPADRRRNLVALTGRGRERLLELDAVLGAVEEEVLAPLSRDERQELGRLLTALVERPRP